MINSFMLWFVNQNPANGEFYLHFLELGASYVHICVTIVLANFKHRR
jgi:hypothetical protein